MFQPREGEGPTKGGANGAVEFPFAPATRATPRAHPDVLWYAGLVAGVDVASPEGCRLLELGCGDGSNLLPIAYRLDGAEVVGVEADPLLFSNLQANAEVLGLTQVAMHHRDPLDPSDLDRFDYVLAPDLLLRPGAEAPPVLAAIATALAPTGVAFLAYPTPAGRALRDELGAALAAAAEGITEPARIVESAREALQAIIVALPEDDTPYMQHLRVELARAVHLGDHALLHEYVWPRPTAYRGPALGRLAETAGLRVVADLGPTTADPRADSSLLFQIARHGRLPAARVSADLIQARDLHWVALAHATVAETPPLGLADRLAAGRLVAPLVCVDPDPWLGPRSPVEFYTIENQALVFDGSLEKATLLTLARAWPGSLSSAELIAEVKRLLEITPGAGEFAEGAGSRIGPFLREMLQSRFVRISPRHHPAASSAPALNVDPVTKLEAARGSRLTGPHHDVAAFDEVDRVIIQEFGGRTPEALQDHLRALARDGTLAFFDGETPWPLETLLPYLEQRLPLLHLRLHHLGVLI